MYCISFKNQPFDLQCNLNEAETGLGYYGVSFVIEEKMVQLN